MQNNHKKVKSNKSSRAPKAQQVGSRGQDSRSKEKNTFTALLNSIVDPVVIIDERGLLLAVNAPLAEISGFSEEELVGKSFFELNISLTEDKMALFEKFKTRSMQASFEPFEVTFAGKTGELGHVEVNAKKISYNGQPAELVILRDVTKRKSLQEQLSTLVNEQTIALKERQERIQSIFDSSPDALTVCDLNATILDCNQTKIDLHRFSKAELIGKSMLDLVSPKDLPRARSTMQKVLETGVLKNVEYTFLTKDGAEFPVECSVSVLKDAAGKPVGYVSTTKNITERKKADEKLQASERRLRNTLDGMFEGCQIISPDWRYLYINDAAAKQGHSTTEALLGKSMLNVYPGVEKTEMFSNLRKCMMQRVPIVAENEFVFQNGEVGWFELSMQPVPEGVFILSFDITERKKAEETLKNSEAKYRELINGMNDTAWVIDLDANFVDVNDAAVKVLGYSRAELLSMGPTDIDDSLSKKQIKALVRRMPIDERQVFETSHTTKDGKRIPVEISSSLVTYQGKQAVLSIARNIEDRKKLKAALMASEEKYHSLFSSMKEGVCLHELVYDEKGKAIDYIILDANAAYESITGIKKDDAIGKKASELYRTTESPYLETYAKVAESRKPVLFETYFPPLKKYFSISVFSPAKGKFATVFTDITERKQLEENLRESEEKFRAISTSANAAIILADDKAKIGYWNPAAERMFGYTSEEIANIDVLNTLIPSKHRKFLQKFLEEPFKTYSKFGGKLLALSALRKDGAEFPIELSVSRLKLKNKPHLLGIVRDVSEQKEMEEELRQERDMLEAVTQNIGAGLVIISKDYRILWANGFIKRFKGDAEGKLCYATLNDLTTPCPDCGVTKIFEKGAASDVHEYKSTTIDGNSYWVEIIATPIKDKDGNVIAASELAIDITERKRMQEKLSEYSQKLEKLVEERTKQLKQAQAKLVKNERLAAIGELAGMVGHDLRNPLTSIKGAAYYLKHKSAAERTAKETAMLETIDSAIEYSNKIVNDLLEYSREIQLDLTETTPKALLKNVLPLVKIPEKIQLKDATQNKPVMNADIGKINRVFVNLIRNAVDAMPNGGTLTVTSKKVQSNVEISFKDTGRGMSKETVSKLWTPLFTTKAQGMGFGLAICKRIVEAHGGRITTESAIGKGTTFTVTLPITPEPFSDDVAT